jgi:hypothetical protein
MLPTIKSGSGHVWLYGLPAPLSAAALDCFPDVLVYFACYLHMLLACSQPLPHHVESWLLMIHVLSPAMWVSNVGFVLLACAQPSTHPSCHFVFG